MEHTVTQTGDTTTIALPVSLDEFELPKLRGTFDELAEAPAGKVVLDCAKLKFLDSAGIGAVAALFARVQEKDRPFEVTGLTGEPLQLFQATGLYRAVTASANPG